MESTMISFKLNRFITLGQQNDASQSPTPSPNDILSIILYKFNEWLVAISNLFSSFFSNYSDNFSHWLDVATHWLAVAAPFIAAGALLLCLLCFLCCCLPAIISCITWVFVAIYTLLSGLFRMVCGAIVSVFRCLCCCASRSGRMMKAPGMVGKLISRSGFESNPAAYFRILHTGPPSFA